MAKTTAAKAAVGAAAPATVTITDHAMHAVHASAQPAQPAPPASIDWPPDQYTGIGGSYTRHPATGVRTPVLPTAPATGTDTAAA